MRGLPADAIPPCLQGPVFLSMCMAISEVSFGWISTGCAAWIGAGSSLVVFVVVVMFILVDRVTYQQRKGDLYYEPKEPLVNAWEQEGEARILRLQHMREDAEQEEDAAKKKHLLAQCRQEQKLIREQMQMHTQKAHPAAASLNGDQSLLLVRPQRSRLKGMIDDFTHLRTRGSWVMVTPAAHRWNFIVADHHGGGWFYAVWVVLKKLWVSAALILSGGMLNAVLAIGAQMVDALTLVILAPYGDRQKSGVEIFTGMTNLLSFFALGLPVMLPRTYLGDTIVLILTSFGTVFVAFVTAFQSIVGFVWLAYALMNDTREVMADGRQQRNLTQKEADARVQAGNDQTRKDRSLEDGSCTSVGPIHDVTCSGCGAHPIRGGRWRCEDCRTSRESKGRRDVDFCDSCRYTFLVDRRYARTTGSKPSGNGRAGNIHDIDHIFTEVLSDHQVNGGRGVGHAGDGELSGRVGSNHDELVASYDPQGAAADAYVETGATEALEAAAVEIEDGGGIGPAAKLSSGQAPDQGLLGVTQWWDKAVSRDSEQNMLGWRKPTLDAWIEFKGGDAHGGGTAQPDALAAAQLLSDIPDAKLGFAHDKP